MRTFHTGGVAGADITHGLPRVVEIFEARNPKGAAKLSEVSGTVKIEDSDRGPKLSILVEGEEEPVSYQLPRRTRVLVADGQIVEPGDALHEGSLNPADLLRLKGDYPRPSCTSSRRCSASTSHRASTSTTSTSS